MADGGKGFGSACTFPFGEWKAEFLEKVDNIDKKLNELDTLKNEVGDIKKHIDSLMTNQADFMNLKAQLGKEKEDDIRAEQERLGKEKDDAIKAEQERLGKEKEDAVREEQERLGKEKEDAVREVQERLGKEKDDAVRETEKRLTPWVKFAEPYEPVREAIEKCDTFKELCSEQKLTTIQDFVRIIGASTDFAAAVYNAAKKEKQQNKESITESERTVYCAMNECYRRTMGIAFDIFIMPGGKSVNEAFSPVDFNKDEAEYMKKPSDKSLRYTKEVYVPMLKNTKGNMLYKAQVDAGNVR